MERDKEEAQSEIMRDEKQKPNPELLTYNEAAIGGRKSKRGKAKKNTSGGRTNRESHLEQERTIEQDGKIYGRAFWK